MHAYKFQFEIYMKTEGIHLFIVFLQNVVIQHTTLMIITQNNLFAMLMESIKLN